MDNEGIAGALEQVADLLEIEGASVFRVRAYRGAARTVSALASPASALPLKGPGSLEELPGIGKDLAGKIRELAETGELALLHELKEKTPESLVHLLEVPGLGPKRAKAIHEGLGIDTIEALERAAREGKLRALKGVGPKLETQILEGIAALAVRGKRISLSEAEAQVEPIVKRLREAPGVMRIEVAGSYRRRRDNVGDVDILVAAEASAAIGKKLIADPATDKVLADGDTKTSVVLKSGLQVDLRVVPIESFGAAMHYFTGSKAHNIAIRTLGVRRKLKINEYGVFDESGARVSGEREEDVFAAVGLSFVPPELREDRGEVDAAREGKLPKLVEHAEVQGDFSIGASAESVEGMVERALSLRAKGASWAVMVLPAVATCEEASASTRALYLESIARAREAVSPMELLVGGTVLIARDGSLETTDEVLAELDVVIGMVPVDPTDHADEKAFTERLATAVRSGRLHVLARPMAPGKERAMVDNKPRAFDVDVVAKACREHGVLMGLPAHPLALVGADAYVRAAKEAGATIAVMSRAEDPSQLERLRYGVDQARRGWCEAKDVANTLGAKDLRARLARR